MSVSSYSEEFDFPSATRSTATVLSSGSGGRALVAGNTIQGQGQGKSSFASFVCHVAFLEKKLRDQGTLFVDFYTESLRNRTRIGKGISFRVEKAHWKPDYKTISSVPGLLRSEKVVALKTVIPPNEIDKADRDWSHILLEIRALLHPPLRYHPNIVTLLGLGWGSTLDSDQVFPQLLLEFAAHGTLHSLQSGRSSLPFAVKQKLSHDVGKGLSILHACDIVHGDVKSENVLVFDNTAEGTETQPYIAKVADFGGSVIDVGRQTSCEILTFTPEYAAPEILRGAVSPTVLKQSDVFSFGLLVCRVFLDGDLSQIHPGFGACDVANRTALAALKSDNRLLTEAMRSIREYTSFHNLPNQCLDLVSFVCQNSLDAEPSNRDLSRSQAALRGTEILQIENLLRGIAGLNQVWSDIIAGQPAGKHGAHIDGVGIELGKLDGYYDPQQNMPGYRPQLEPPEEVGYLFEPHKLKHILNWIQQECMIQDFKLAAEASQALSNDNFRPSQAAFYLFNCYLSEYGTNFDARQACEWLWKAGKEAAEGRGEGGVDYLAGAWAWRISNALNAVPEGLFPKLPELLSWAVLRGHVTGQEDGAELLRRLTNAEQKEYVTKKIESAVYLAQRVTGAMGAAAFMPTRLIKSFRLHDIPIFESQLRDELGPSYEQCLKTKAAENGNEVPMTQPSAIDLVIINGRGHGILHLAANMGQTEVLRYLVSKYIVNIDLPNQDCEETPLICACRGGHLETSIFLLEAGANPNGHPQSQETPLHWLRSFRDADMEIIATKLVQAGANIEAPSGQMRADVRKVHADWEDLFSIPVTPLGRAVILKSLPAVRVLLKLGANALRQIRGASAIDLASLLTLPEYLRLLLDSLEGTSQSTHIVSDEDALLEAAHKQRYLKADTLSLLSRLVRHGATYHESMHRTLFILKERRVRLLPDQAAPSGKAICREVQMGNIDIVRSLLEMGHDPNGSYFNRPLVEAVRLNHVQLVDLLLRFGAEWKQYPENNGKTFLQVLAERSPASRSGSWIGQKLLEANISTEAVAEGTRPPLQSAIINHDFELADLLLQHGAKINAAYQTGIDGRWVTILWDLIHSHTKNSLRSLRYVLGKPCQHASSNSQADSLGLRMSSLNLESANEILFVVDKSNCLSALQVLAACPQRLFNFEDTTSLQICQLILGRFGQRDQLDFVHPVLGTALCQAVLSRNKMMIGLLLDMKADVNLPANSRFFSHDLVSSSGLSIPYGQGRSSPVWLALSCYAGSLERIQIALKDVTDEQKMYLKDHHWIIERLLSACPDDLEEAAAAFRALQGLQQRLHLGEEPEVTARTGMLSSSLSSATQPDLPADLSIEDVFPLPKGIDARTKKQILEFRALVKFMTKNHWFGKLSHSDLQRAAQGHGSGG